MSLWTGEAPLVLASRSAIRRQLLVAAGLSCEVQPADIDERRLEKEAGTTSPAAVAALLATAKARAVAERMPGRLVLGADQTLALGDRIFSKPEGRDGAVAQLSALRGRTHALHAGIAVHADGECVFNHTATALLTMREFSDSFLDAYLDQAGADVFASVGGYQLEGFGVHLFERIEGDYFTILGLPLIPLLAFLRRHGYVAA